MRWLLAALAVALPMTAGAGCGASSGRTGTSGSTQPSRAPDRDNDGDHNDDDAQIVDFGHAAGGTDQYALVALVKRYYQAAAAGNGAKGCAMLAPFIAESVAEQYGHSAPLRGRTCAVVMSKLYRSRHSALAHDSATVKVLRVRVEGNRALTILHFAGLPEVRQFPARRIAGRWTFLNLFDGIVE